MKKAERRDKSVAAPAAQEHSRWLEMALVAALLAAFFAARPRAALQ